MINSLKRTSGSGNSQLTEAGISRPESRQTQLIQGNQATTLNNQ